MTYFSKGPLPPSFEPNEKIVKSEGYGWRKSSHDDWKHSLAGHYNHPDDWAWDINRLLQKLLVEDDEQKIRLCTKSFKGKIENEIFIGTENDYKNENKICDLTDSRSTIFFDPVPWKNGKRLKKTRFGYGGVTNGHPFDFFPEPCIYWSVGNRAFQFLVPWQKPVYLKSSAKLLSATPINFTGRFIQPKDELLVLPGSVVFNDPLPPFTAEVLFDAFSFIEFEEQDWLWTKY